MYQRGSWSKGGVADVLTRLAGRFADSRTDDLPTARRGCILTQQARLAAPPCCQKPVYFLPSEVHHRHAATPYSCSRCLRSGRAALCQARGPPAADGAAGGAEAREGTRQRGEGFLGCGDCQPECRRAGRTTRRPTAEGRFPAGACGDRSSTDGCQGAGLSAGGSRRLSRPRERGSRSGGCAGQAAGDIPPQRRRATAAPGGGAALFLRGFSG